ncbi:hypothetical protein SADUNF_Sadunf19G0026300 [Salix dunnii]|uniref:H/ACA ribonucleoprotein complex subunit n=1 Tax=Salix dunnii TaxID=1413687 RepID=A0A835IY31_9ROSI|nr:hypothetical protein SADUNF_Sadunf19G0026300 [Salix dunnii]
MRPPRGGGFRGGRDGGFRGGRGGRGGPGRGGRGFGGGGYRDEGPPSEVVEVSSFLHASEGDAVTKLTNEKIPYFNAPIFLQNKTQIGKVDEIFGPINESHFSIKMMEGIVATSYAPGDKFYIDPNKLLPLARFLSQPKCYSLFVLACKPAITRCQNLSSFGHDNIYTLILSMRLTNSMHDSTSDWDRHKELQEVAVVVEEEAEVVLVVEEVVLVVEDGEGAEGHLEVVVLVVVVLGGEGEDRTTLCNNCALILFKI